MRYVNRILQWHCINREKIVVNEGLGTKASACIGAPRRKLALSTRTLTQLHVVSLLVKRGAMYCITITHMAGVTCVERDRRRGQSWCQNWKTRLCKSCHEYRRL